MVAAASGIILLVMGLKGVNSFAQAPFKYVLCLIFKVVIALGVLCLVNLLGGYWGFHLPVNIFTVLVVTFFQIPGLILVGALNFLLI